MLKITRENDAVFYPRKEKTLLDTLTTTMYARQRAITRLVYITLTHQDTEKGHHSLWDIQVGLLDTHDCFH